MRGSKVDQRTGFIFFLEWQYHQRRQFLFHYYRQCVSGMEKEGLKQKARERAKKEIEIKNADVMKITECELKFPTIANVDEFIYKYNEKRSNRYRKDSEKLIEKYLSRKIRLDNLSEFYPLWIPRQHPVAAVHYDMEGYPVDVENIRPGNDGSEREHYLAYKNVMKNKSSLDSDKKTEMHDPQDGAYCFANIESKTYNADGIESKKITEESLESHLIGLWLWDKHTTHPEPKISRLIERLLTKFPDLSASKRLLSCASKREEQKIYNKCRENFRMVKNEIGYTTLLDTVTKEILLAKTKTRRAFSTMRRFNG